MAALIWLNSSSTRVEIDFSDTLNSSDRRYLAPLAGAHVAFRAVDSEGSHTNADLTICGFRNGQVAGDQVVGRPKRIEHDCFHNCAA